MPNKKIRKVYLLGVNHRVQWDKNFSLTDKYKEYLKYQIENLNIDFIAEEFSEEALRQNGVESTTSNRISIEKLNKNSVLCDPDEKTREKIGYPTKKQLRKMFGVRSAIEGTDEYKSRKEFIKNFYCIRERYWFNQIGGKNFKKLIFICGVDHLRSFQILLKEEGYDTSILDKKFVNKD